MARAATSRSSCCRCSSAGSGLVLNRSPGEPHHRGLWQRQDCKLQAESPAAARAGCFRCETTTPRASASGLRSPSTANSLSPAARHPPRCTLKRLCAVISPARASSTTCWRSLASSTKAPLLHRHAQSQSPSPATGPDERNYHAFYQFCAGMRLHHPRPLLSRHARPRRQSPRRQCRGAVALPPPCSIALPVPRIAALANASTCLHMWLQRDEHGELPVG